MFQRNPSSKYAMLLLPENCISESISFGLPIISLFCPSAPILLSVIVRPPACRRKTPHRRFKTVPPPITVGVPHFARQPRERLRRHAALLPLFPLRLRSGGFVLAERVEPVAEQLEIVSIIVLYPRPNRRNLLLLVYVVGVAQFGAVPFVQGELLAERLLARIFARIDEGVAYHIRIRGDAAGICFGEDGKVRRIRPRVDDLARPTRYASPKLR